ncbi:MAG: MOSC domain-containing protein [Chthoniobacterales bacterium]|nr:MOSC domain-containing protein [Chthoniobacterales bacterium]
MPEASEISFTDAFPTLLTSESSLADLNSRLTKAIPMERFRPNIVVRGSAPFDEDSWSCLRAGEAVFHASAACLRCVITTTDQRTGKRDGVEPLRTLGIYRRAADHSGVMFGQYLVHSGAGTLRVDDVLSVQTR